MRTPRGNRPATDTDSRSGSLHRTLGTPKIVFLVVAAASPLAAVVGTVPLAFALGNGVAVPAMFVFAGLTLLLFSVGYAAMSRRIVTSGGFYGYLAAGLGRPAAVAGGWVAVIAYNTATVGMTGAFAYFTQLVASSYGLDLPWQVWAAIGLAAMGVLGYCKIDFSARVLAVLMVAEVAILTLLDIAVLIRDGGAALPVSSFAPAAVFGPGLGVALMFALISFIGFESAALYGEEARDPRRSVPLATYWSVGLIAVFYTLSSWIAVGAVGPDRLRDVAAQQLGALFGTLTDDYLNTTMTTGMQVLLCTSLFAGMLAMHGAANRYLFSLSRDRVLPAGLDVVHPRHGSPSRASLTQTVFTVTVSGIAALAGADPYVNLATTMTGLGTVGIVVLQGAAALSVIAYFRRRPGRHWWRTGLAPLLGLGGLVVSTVLVVANFDLLTGSTNPLVNSLPWLYVAVTVAGFGFASWLRARRPGRYDALSHVAVERVEPTAAPLSRGPGPTSGAPDRGQEAA